MMTETLSQIALKHGGFIKPLIIPAEHTDGTGLMNPSILIDGEKILLNIRHVNYTIYHSEKKKFLHEWGPLVYLHPEHYQKLKTTNFYCELDSNYNITKCNAVDTTKLDKEPLWEFVGLEDARIVRWNDKLYLSGVRRDTTTNGEGRIELSEIIVTDTEVKELERYRIQPPIHKDSYCEKNWMPIIDKDFHYVKWANPTEVVEVDVDTLSSKQKFVGTYLPLFRDIRGGSQLIPWNDHYIALTHEVELFKDMLGRKDGIYRHRFVIWNKDFTNMRWSDDFTFLGGEIEFCAGMAFHNGNFLATFGFQDNSACILGIPEKIIKDIFSI